MAVEIESFVASVLLEDRNVGDLLTADHTFLNERLARHYGITSVLGPQFRRVTLEDSRRWGLLGKGRGAAADVVRRSHVAGAARRMGARQADGNAADAAAARCRHQSLHAQRRSAEDAAGAARKSSLEARLQPVPWRDRSDRSGAGELRRHRPMARQWTWTPRPRSMPGRCCPSGRAIDGPVQLREALFGGRDLFVRAFTEKLMMYAVGRELKVLRHAAGPCGRSPGRGAGLPAVGDRVWHRDERCVPHAGGRLHEAPQRQAAVRRTDHVPDEETPVPPDRAARRRRHAGPAAAGCHDSGRDRAGADGRGAEDAHGIFLHPARRDHGQHLVRPGDGSVDAERRGRRLQAQPDPRRRSSRTSATSPRSGTSRTRPWWAACTVSPRRPG